MLRPIDIHNAEFKRSFKGYNEQEVDAFLEKVGEKAYEENCSKKPNAQGKTRTEGKFDYVVNPGKEIFRNWLKSPRKL